MLLTPCDPASPKIHHVSVEGLLAEQGHAILLQELDNPGLQITELL